MIISRIECFPLRIPLKVGRSDVSAWGGKDLPAAESLLVKVTTDQSVPQGPGLGIDPHPDVVRAYLRK